MSVFSETVDWFTDAAHWSGSDGIPARFGEHLGYSALALGIAAVIAIPIGLWIGHTGRLRGVAVVLSGAVRALPTLGLLTGLVLLAGIGLGAPIASLVVLSIPPLLAGAYAGVESVDADTVAAAKAIGFTGTQVLTRVEIPLALPVILGGVRSAALQVIATATITAYVGLGGLGRYIFDGQAVRDYPRMVAGSVLVIVLALVVDAAILAAQRFFTTSHRRTR